MLHRSVRNVQAWNVAYFAFALRRVLTYGLVLWMVVLPAVNARAVDLLTQNFEVGHTVNYTNSAFVVATDNYWALSNAVGITLNPNLTGATGVYLTGQDMDDGLPFTTTAPASITFNTFSVAGYSNLKLSLSLAGGLRAETVNYVRGLLDTNGDGTYETTVFNFAGNDNSVYTDAGPNAQGTLGLGFTTKSNIPLAFPTAVDGLLRFRIEVFNDTANLEENVGIDSILITGTAPGKNLTWNVPAGGTWDTGVSGNTAWLNITPAADFFTNNDDATFSQTPAAGAITVAAGGVAPASLAVSHTSGTYTFTGAGITSASLAKSNGGDVVFNNTGNSFGATTISGGSATFANATTFTSLAVSNGTVVLNAASSATSVQLTGGAINGAGTLTNTAAYDVQAGSVGAILAGGVALNKTAAGTVTLNNANTYTGLTSVTAGTLAYGVSDAIATGGVTVNGATAVLSLGAFNDSVGTVTLDGGGQITGGGTLTSTGTFDLRNGTISASLAGAAPLNKTTPTTVTLNNANTYTGLTNITAGALAYGANNALGTGGVTVNGGMAVLSLGAFTDSVGTVTVDGGGQITGGGTLTSTGTFEMKNGTVGAILAGGVALNKTTAATVTLNNANTYSGATSITGAGSILALGATGSIANSPTITVGSGATFNVLAVGGGYTLASQTLTGPGTVTGTLNTNGTSIVNPGTGTGVLAVNGGLTIAGGTYNFDLTPSPGTIGDGTNDLVNVTGNINISATTTVTIFGNTAANTYTLFKYTGTLTGTVGGAGGLQVTPSTSRGSYTLNNNTSAKAVEVIVGASTPANMRWSGAGNANWQAVSGPNNWYNTDSSLADNFFSNDLITFGEEGTPSVVPSNTDPIAIVGTVSPGSITINNVATPYTFNGSGKISGTTGLVKQGSGTATINNSTANEFTGLTDVQAGLLNLNNTGGNAVGGALTVSGATGIARLQADNQIANGGAVTVSGGGTLDLQTFSDTVASVTLTDGTISGTGAGQITSTAAYALQNGSISAIMAGTAGANKTTSGTVTLSAANTYTGVLAVSDGTLIVTSTQTPTTTTVSGATTILETQAANAVGSAAAQSVTLSGGGTWKLTTVAQTQANNIIVGAGGGTIDIGATAGDITFNGTVNLGTAATNTLNVNVAAGAGTVKFNTDNWLTAGTAAIISTVNFTNNSSNPILVNNFGNNAYVTVNVLAGIVQNNTNGSMIPDEGTINISSGATFDMTGQTGGEGMGWFEGAGNLILPAGQTVNLNNNGVPGINRAFSGVISGTGSMTLNKTTALSSWTLTGVSTFTGNVTVTAGILEFNTANNGGTASALGAASTTITVGAAGILKFIGTDAAQATTDRSITLAATGATIDASGSVPLTLSGGVTGATFNLNLTGTGAGVETGVIGTTTGNVVKNGTGSWKLSGVNTYTGTTTVSAGNLLVGANAPSAAVGALGNSATDVNIGGGADNSGLLTDAAVTVGRNLFVSAAGGGTVTLGGNSAHNSTLAGTTTINKNVTLSAVLGGKADFSGLIDDGVGSFAVTKSGAGTVVLSQSGGNTYDGGTTIEQGTLLVNNTSGSGTGTGAVSVTGGTLGGTGSISGAVTFSAGVGTLAPGPSLATAGTLTVASLNLNGTALNYEMHTGFTDGDKTVVTGAMIVVGSNAVSITALSPLANGNYDLISFNSSNGGGTFTLNPVPSRGTFGLVYGGVSATPGVVQLTVSNVGAPVSLKWTGANGALWNVNATQNWYDTTLLAADKYYDGDTVSFDDTGANTSLDIVGVRTPGATNISVNNSVVDYAFGTTGGGSLAGNAGILKQGSQKLTLTTVNSLTGGTDIQGGTVEAFATTAIGSGSLSLSGGSTLDIATFNQTVAGITLTDGTISATNATLTNSGSIDVQKGTIAANLTGTLGLNKTTSDIVTLSGVNTYTGTLSISGGALIVTKTQTPTMTAVAGTATVLETQASNGVGSTAAQSVSLTSGGTWLLSTAAQTQANNINVGSGGGNIVIDGTGAKTLSGIIAVGTDSLTVTVNPGAGQLSIGGAANNTATAGSSASLTIVNNSATEVLLNNLGDAFHGTLNIAGTGIVRNNVNGAFLPNDTTINIAAGATFDLSGQTGNEGLGWIEGAGNLVIPVGALVTDTANVNLNTNTLSGLVRTLSGNISQGGAGLGKGSLTFNNNTAGATWVLSGTNTYAGPTTVSAGTLRFGQLVSLYNNTPASWTDTNIIVNSGATLAFNVGGTGEFTSTELDALAALGTATGGYRSGSTIGFDTTNASGGTFTYATPIANTNAGANVRHINKLGTNTLTLTGTNTYTGNTTVSEGTLNIVNLPNGANTTVAAGAFLNVGDAGTGAITQAALTVNGTATVLASTPSAAPSVGNNGGTSHVGTLSIANLGGPIPRTYTGTLDLQNNDLIVDTATLPDVTDMIRSGSNSSSWTGTGITSGTAAGAGGATSLGVMQNITNPVTNTGGAYYNALNPFDGQSTRLNAAAFNGTEILVKYTWTGDFDLDGKITAFDYALLDAGLVGTTQLSDGKPGWFFGDADYNGVVDTTDYNLLSAGLAAYTSAGNQQLPEPSTFLLGALGLLGLLAARRRKV